MIEHDPELPMETEIDNTSANNLSQYPVADPSCETGVVEPSSSKSESIGATSGSSAHQVELQLRGLTQDVTCRQLPVYHRVYVDGFVQGVGATLRVDTGAVNTIVSHRLFKKISRDHCPKLTKAAQVDAAGGKPLKSVQCLILLMNFCLVRISCSVTHQVQLILSSLRREWYSMVSPFP